MADAQLPSASTPHCALRIAVLGAECTGKTELVLQLREALAEQTGLRVAAVPEFLREWCDLHQRTPEAGEQQAIADEQQRRIEEAVALNDIVVCDTTALMTAVYSHWYFADASLDDSALRAHRRSTLTLVTALDIPWKPDGLQRDGEAVRRAIDTQLRAMLARNGVAFQEVAGTGPQRLQAALAIIQPRACNTGPKTAGHTQLAGR